MAWTHRGIPSAGALAALLLTAACSSDPTGPPVRDESAPLQTDVLAYTAVLTETQGSFEVTFEYRNPTSDVRWLSRCHDRMDVILQRRGSGWSDVWVPDCPRAATTPIEVGPGETHVETVTIAGTHPSIPNAAPYAPAPGRYRALVTAWTAWSFEPGEEGPPDGALAPLEERVSNEFDVAW